MLEQARKAEQFSKLHIKGDPIILYNVWDGGSARAVAGAGVKAIATGDHPVGYAHGFTDATFGDFTFDMYLRSIQEIAACIGELPLSVDISNGDGLEGDALVERINTVMDAGAVGVNFEDLEEDGTLRPTEVHAERIRLIREVAVERGVPLYINARTDLFMVNKGNHSQLIDEAVEKSEAFREAGASGFFVPGLKEIAVIKELCERVSLPVNIIKLPDTPTTRELSDAGVARISYGPVPQMEMSEWLKAKAGRALAGEDGAESN